MEKLSLNGAWSLIKCSEKAKTADVANLDTSKAYKATVPGCVHTDLMKAGVIPDPFIGLNDKEVQWIEKESWVYVKEFHLDGDALDYDEAELYFEGLDTFAAIYLNEHKVGACDNMFIPWRFPVKKALQAGRNKLVVTFDSPVKKAAALEKKYGKIEANIDTTRVHIRKSQFQFGWDWAPRLVTSGIWRDVSLHFYNSAQLNNYYIRFTDITKKRARGEITVDYTILARFNGEIEVTLTNGDTQISQTASIKRKTGSGSVRIKLDVPNPRLWYPNGMGQPHLYEVTIAIKDGDDVLDTLTGKVGIRKIELMRPKDKEGEKFFFKINGTPIFCKGANWVPADSFPSRITRQKYRKLLVFAKDAGYNMLRVWGGGIYEDDEFYKTCDELGIMLWHDFMFACAQYPEYDAFAELVQTEANTIVKRLRNHPSIVLWCGNNENQAIWGIGGTYVPGNLYYDKVLPSICRKLDPSRPYWPGSPYGGLDPQDQSEGDRHAWDVWTRVNYPEYLKEKGRFQSEFGYRGFPYIKTVQEFLTTTDKKKRERELENHYKMIDTNLAELYGYLFEDFPLTDDLGKLTYFSQVNQANAIKTGVEHFRRRKFNCAGALSWQYNDCWPELGWSVVDYALRPKALFYWSKKFFAPELVSMYSDADNCCVHYTSDLLEPRDVNIDFTIQDFAGKIIKREKKNVTIAKNSSKRVMKFALKELLQGLDKDAVFAYATASVAGKTAAENTFFFNRFKFLRLPKAKITTDITKKNAKEFELKLTSSVFAFAVGVEVTDGEFSASDNFFHLLPSKPHTITVKTEREYTQKKFKGVLTIRCLNNE